MDKIMRVRLVRRARIFAPAVILAQNKYTDA